MEPLRAHLWGRLSTADLMWKDASPWYWKNDLDALSKALTLLRDVRDLLPFVADKDIQNKYFEVYGYIKSSVPSSDWDTVQARAGMLHEK
jgi:hypothetical protein